MASLLLFSYFIDQDTHYVQENDAIWQNAIPMNRRAAETGDVSITYGDYFTAVRSFLERNDFEVIRSAVSQSSNQQVHPEEIEGIHVYLVKHGEFYHPSRIDVTWSGIQFKFVLNVAVSDAGKACIERESHVLKTLQHTFSHSFVPRIYGKGEVRVNPNQTIKMFIGEWFEGYHEFHISRDSNSAFQKAEHSKNKSLIVWDTEKGNFYLTPEQAMHVYQQAAMIMTCYYNLETFEQILPWHHAAGDFVVKVLKDTNGNSIDLKLITVRQYASQIGIPPDGDGEAFSKADMILDALLLFLLNLSIRMRLDRMDGVGDIVWADDIAVYGTVKGFFEGLKQKRALAGFACDLVECFQEHFRSYTLPDLYEFSNLIVNSYHPLAPDIPVIKENLENHLCVLSHAVCQNASMRRSETPKPRTKN